MLNVFISFAGHLQRWLLVVILLGGKSGLAFAALQAPTTDALSSLADDFESDAIVVYCETQQAFSQGEVAERFNVASIRKSIVSALYGIAIQKGLIDPDKSLADIGFDDPVNRLSEEERQATLRHLLQSRSGIYLPALGESGSMKRRKPRRGAHEVGAYFYYNNWDFNALGVAFEQITGLTLGEAFQQWLAAPLGMQDFREQDVIYQAASGEAGLPMYRFYLTARDLARFGALYANRGSWDGAQLIPQSWIEETFTVHSNVPYGIWDGYGMLWWYKTNSNTWWGLGSGGQRLVVDLVRKTSIVLMNNTGQSYLGRLLYRTFSRPAPNWEAFAVHEVVSGDTRCGAQ